MLSTLKNRIYLNDLSSLINRKDKRSIRVWCRKNQLQIYKDSSGEFVNENEFDLVYNLPIIKKLQQKYGDYWQVYYEAYKEGSLYKVLDLNIGTTNNQSRYIPKGKLSAKLFGLSPK